MSLRRLFVNDRLLHGSELRLGDEPARYLGRVLRLKSGDAVNVFNGEDGEWAATITRFEKHGVVLVIRDRVANDRESRLRIHLVQGISRGERMDFVVQKATELGVSRISPVLTDHGVVRFDDKRAAKRCEHWRRVAESACEQSGRTCPPRIDAPQPLNYWFGTAPREEQCNVVLNPAAAIRLAGMAVPDAGLCLLIGPEGGFSEREYEDAKAAGFEAASLGPRILRTETAAIAAVALAQSSWGDL
jgi:16S rRNA (uracil1498-N3)-methyltransferase